MIMMTFPTSIKTSVIIIVSYQVSRIFYILKFLLLATIFELQAHVVTTRGYLTIEGHRRLGKAYKRILVSHIENVQHVIQGRTGIYGSQFDIEKEICRIYAEYVGTVYKRLLPAQKTDEELVYCWKM